MELLLNLTWLALSAALGVLIITTMSRGKAVSRYSRSAVWVCYLVLIAMLLPAISMTDDLMAMAAPSDGEQITRRHEVSMAGQNHLAVPVLLFHARRDRSVSPPAFRGSVEILPDFQVFAIAPAQSLQGRAPPELT